MLWVVLWSGHDFRVDFRQVNVAFQAQLVNVDFVDPQEDLLGGVKVDQGDDQDDPE